MSNRVPRLTTRSRQTAEYIRDGKDFTTSGNLKGEAHPSYRLYIYQGHLNSVECELLRADAAFGIDYVVWSYSTPIAWRRTDGKWRIVAQSFSNTTSKHQGNLYLIEREEHEGLGWSRPARRGCATASGATRATPTCVSSP